MFSTTKESPNTLKQVDSAIYQTSKDATKPVAIVIFDPTSDEQVQRAHSEIEEAAVRAVGLVAEPVEQADGQSN